MSSPVLYIFDPESPEHGVIEIPFQETDSEYVINDYIFLAAEAGSVSVSCRLTVTDLSFFVSIKEFGKPKVALSGRKISRESGDPIVVYNCPAGAPYQIQIKI